MLNSILTIKRNRKTILRMLNSIQHICEITKDGHVIVAHPIIHVSKVH